MLYLKHNGHAVILEDEQGYIHGDNLAQRRKVFEHIYALGEPSSPTSAHSAHYGEPEWRHSCLVLASRAPTTIHSQSGLLHDDQCILAVSNFLVALHLPDLSLSWASDVDSASIFGVYHLPQMQSYIVHGELDIARVAYNGHSLWSSGGKDIFTKGFTLYDHHIEAVDFNDEKYLIDLETGRSRLVNS
jgi:hypothetical protein